MFIEQYLTFETASPEPRALPLYPEARQEASDMAQRPCDAKTESNVVIVRSTVESSRIEFRSKQWP